MSNKVYAKWVTHDDGLATRRPALWLHEMKEPNSQTPADNGRSEQDHGTLSLSTLWLQSTYYHKPWPNRNLLYVMW